MILKIDGSFTIENSSISVDNGTGVEWLSVGVDEYTVRLNAEGVYQFTASVTGADGNVYQDTIVITVMNREQLDNLLKAKWEGMKGALISQNIGEALTFFSDELKEHYNDVFSALYFELPQLAQGMQDIQLITASGNNAKYRIRRTELYNGQTLSITYYIYFGIDKNGTWKIIWY